MFKKVKRILFASLLLFGMSTFPIILQAIAAEPSIVDCLEDEEGCRSTKEEKNEQNNKEVEENEEQWVGEQRSTITFWTYVKLILSFLFVIGLLYALLQFVNKRNQQMSKHRFMKNLGGVPLGQNKSVQVISIGEQYFIIGVGEDVQLIKEITSTEEKERLTQLVEEGRLYENEKDPVGYFKSLIKLKKEQPNAANTTTSFQQLFQSEMDKAKKERQQKMDELVEKERERNE